MMKWVWIWDALWIVGGLVHCLRSPEVPVALWLTPEEDEASKRRALSRVRIYLKDPHG